MVILGAHMSVAGGLHKGVEAAHQAACDCVQIFSKNNSQWRAKPISDDQALLFRSALDQTGIRHTLVHTSYLINLASPDDLLWQKSIDAFVVEIERASQLGISHLVFHPGAFTTSSEEAGLQRIVAALTKALRQTPEANVTCLLETTAGQGSNLGHRFDHLAVILEGVGCPDRLGVCLDTCHVFAAGYAFQTPTEYQRMIQQLDQIVGVDFLKAIHLNDSKQPLGSRKDRHEHIGKGCLGLEPFRNLLNDQQLREIPMYLETPKGHHEETSWDEINLATLRGLVHAD